MRLPGVGGKIAITHGTNHRVLSAGHGDAIRTVVYTGRPMRVRKTLYNQDWCVVVHL